MLCASLVNAILGLRVRLSVAQDQSNKHSSVMSAQPRRIMLQHQTARAIAPTGDGLELDGSHTLSSLFHEESA